MNNASIRKELVQKIYKYVIDETGYLISLPDEVIAGILRLIQSSSLSVEEPWTWYELKTYGPPENGVPVITWNGEDKCIDRWEDGKSENFELSRIVAEIGKEDYNEEIPEVTHWMYMPTDPKD